MPAVKVGETFNFECRNYGDKYGLYEAAKDGGVWKLDPAEYDMEASSIRTYLYGWAKAHGYSVKVHWGSYEKMLYYSFTEKK